MSAAGRPAGFEVVYTYTSDEYGPQFTRMGEVYQQMIEAGNDFKLKANVVSYQAVFRNGYHFNEGKFEGIAFGSSAALPTVDAWLFNWVRSGSLRTGHFAAPGQVDTQLDSLIDRQRAESNAARRTEIIQEIQRYSASKMYQIFEPGTSLGFTLHQPWVGNLGVYRAYEGGVPSVETIPHMFIDSSKKSA